LGVADYFATSYIRLVHNEQEITMINQIYRRNNTGHLVLVTRSDGRRVGFYKLHQQTRQRIGSEEFLGATKFALRYCPL
jgi:hypothetical protein